eukprot:CAMPEP_0181510052 /NCGR_PEP_ID=MMETSP1110-20121109/60676_1 /TAXON_ID=174948 /ORGANISM="Symbiodinium sp., Strain CCMP421" /LENGTH=59 /DNA_ID=CAMNT_0023639659 /DNA_START=62 /DNA_END=238 /DNA_ORIENTATION=-
MAVHCVDIAVTELQENLCDVHMAHESRNVQGCPAKVIPHVCIFHGIKVHLELFRVAILS